MPITGPTSFLTTTDDFLGHWDAADTTLGAGNELKLKDGSARAALQTLKDALVAKRALLQGKLNVEEVARGDIETRKTALLVRLNQFNEKVRFLFGGTKWERALPDVPSQTDGQGAFTTPLDDAATLWLLINDDPAIPDITLLGGYTQSGFLAEIAAINVSFTAFTVAARKAKVVLEERNDIQDEIYEKLKGYRLAVPTYFAIGSAILDSLPDLTPPPGSTPAAVHLSGGWNELLSAVELNVTESTDPNLLQIEIRACNGPNYDANVETVVANLPPGTLSVTNTFNLNNAGDTRSFRGYVITTTGNEKGSNTVTIVRPAAPPPP